MEYWECMYVLSYLDALLCYQNLEATNIAAD